MQNQRTPRQTDRYLRTFSLALAAAIIGGIAWGINDLAGLSVFLFALWASCRSKKQAFIVGMAYYLGGSWVIPESSRVFFGESWSLALGLAMWVVAAILNASVMAYIWRPSHQQRLRERVLSVSLQHSALFIALLIPPFAFVGWLNPFLGAAWFFTGMGLVAFCLGWLLSVAIGVSTPWISESPPRLIAFLAIGVMATVLGQNALPAAPDSWVGVDTSLGQFPSNEFESFEKRRFIAEEASRQIFDGKKVIIFPETVLGHWSDNTTGAYLSGALRSQLAEHDATIVVGAIFQSAVTGDMQNSVAVLSGDGAKKLDSRQSIPVAMWKPWAADGVASNWNSTGVHEIAGKKVMLSFCYEDFIPTLPLVSFIADKPDLIVSVANGWWVKGTNAPAIQLRHITTIAKVFNVPLIRAFNT